MNHVRKFFEPSSIAVIGASAEHRKIGGRPIHSMTIAGFDGAVYPVNPNRSEIQGRPCYPSVSAIPGLVDLALIALPAPMVAGTIEACAKKGISAAIIFSAGFAEVGSAGRAEQSRVIAAARKAGVRIMGPNCMGTMNAPGRVIASFTSTIGDVPPKVGYVSVASQSGAFGAHIFSLLRARGVGIDLWATTGNESDVDVAECIEYMARACNTRVIVGCVEGVRDGARFVRALDVARMSRKPVILMKLGASQIGAAAAASHTAALTGSDVVFDSVLRHHGAWRAKSVDELIDLAYCCSFGRFPRSPSLGLATVSGGFGVIMADAAAEANLDLPPLPARTQARLRRLVPFASTRNPIDVTAQFINDPALVEPMLDALLTGGRCGSAILFLGASGAIGTLMAGIFPGLARVAQRHADRLLVLCMIADERTRARAEKLGYLVFEDATRAVRSLGTLVTLTNRLGKRIVVLPTSTAVAGEAIKIPERCNEHQAKLILARHGIPVVRERVARSPGEAARAARAIGFPVAMKVLSADLAHKSDVGGVALGLRNQSEVEAAYSRMVAAVNRKLPLARVDGVIVSPMLEDGVEVILGIARDETFGPVVLVGLGGVFVEILSDTTCRLAPFDPKEAHEMLRELKGFALLDGARGRRVDVDALARTLASLSRFAAASADRLHSVDINPFLVRRRGGVALDALIIPRATMKGADDMSSESQASGRPARKTGVYRSRRDGTT